MGDEPEYRPHGAPNTGAPAQARVRVRDARKAQRTFHTANEPGASVGYVNEVFSLYS